MMVESAISDGQARQGSNAEMGGSQAISGLMWERRIYCREGVASSFVLSLAWGCNGGAQGRKRPSR